MPGTINVRGQGASFGIAGVDQIAAVTKALSELPKTAGKHAQRTAISAILRDFVKDHLAPNIRSGLHNMNALARARYSKTLKVKATVSKRGTATGKVFVPRTETSKDNEKFGFLSHIFEKGARPHKIVTSKGFVGVARNVLGKKRGRSVSQHPGIKGVPVWGDTFDAQEEALFNAYTDAMFGAMQIEFQKIQLKAK